jgi:hypothetical protein
VPSRRRLALVLAGAVLFGVLAAWLKGQDGDGIGLVARMRADVGNLSGPWLLLPFLAGSTCSRMRSGAVLGLLATLLGLVGFYALTGLVLDVDGQGFPRSAVSWAAANRIWFGAGLASGPIAGALGVLWRLRSGRPAWVPAGLLLVGEPVVLAGLGLVPEGVGARLPLPLRLPLTFGHVPTALPEIVVTTAEFLAGAALLALARSRLTDGRRG